MPPKKTPPKPKDQDAGAALVLYAKNLDEVIRWYRRPKESGHDYGHYVLTEHILSHVHNALVLALQGKEWKPPTPTP